MDVTGTWYKVENDIKIRRERRLQGMENLDNRFGEPKELAKQYLGDIPLMLRSQSAPEGTAHAS